MSAKLFALVVAILVAVLAVAQAQSPDAAPVAPTFEELVQQREASTLRVLDVMVASSTAPQELKDVVLANSQSELTACVEQAAVHGNRGFFYACTGQVLKNAGNALSAATSSGASATN